MGSRKGSECINPKGGIDIDDEEISLINQDVYNKIK